MTTKKDGWRFHIGTSSFFAPYARRSGSGRARRLLRYEAFGGGAHPRHRAADTQRAMNRPRQLSSVPQSGPASPVAEPEEAPAVALDRCICLVGGSEAMATVRAQLRRVSAHFRMVLITGEAGTGKEIVARTMHSLSAQPEMPFISHSAAAFLPLMPELLAGAGDAANSGAGAVSRLTLARIVARRSAQM